MPVIFDGDLQTPVVDIVSIKVLPSTMITTVQGETMIVRVNASPITVRRDTSRWVVEVL